MPMAKKIPKYIVPPHSLEMSPDKQELFLRFYEMGTQRSAAKLSSESGVPATTIAKWSSKYGWIERIRRIDSQSTKIVEQKIIDKNAKAKEMHIALIDGMIAKIVDKRTKKIKITPKDPKQVVELMKMRLLLTGEADSRSENNVKLTMPELFEQLEKKRALERGRLDG